MDVELKPVIDYPGYLAGSDGNIYSTRSGTLLCLGQRIHRGYLRVNVLSPDGKKRSEQVHKLVLSAFSGSRPDGLQCRHLNGNATDNRASNLKWGTPKENMHDEMVQGTAACLRCGEDSNAAKLTIDDIYEIRRLHSEGKLLREVSEWFHISTRHVRDIANGRTWVKTAPLGR